MSETQETQFILRLDLAEIKLFYLKIIVRLSGPRLYIFSYIVHGPYTTQDHGRRWATSPCTPLTTHYSGRKGGTAWREKSTSTGSWMFRAGTFPSSLQGSEGSAGTTLPCIGSNVAGGDVRLKAHRGRGGRPGAVAPSRGLAGGSRCRVRRCGRWWRRHTMEKIMWRPGQLKGWWAEHCGSTSMYFFARDGGDSHVGQEEE